MKVVYYLKCMHILNYTFKLLITEKLSSKT